MLVYEHPPKRTKRAFTTEEAYYFSTHQTSTSSFHDDTDELKTIEEHLVDIDLQLGTNSIFHNEHLMNLRHIDVLSSQYQNGIASRIVTECHEIFARHHNIRSIRMEFPPDIDPLFLADVVSGFDLPQWALSNLYAQSNRILFSFLRDVYWVTVENEKEFPILSHISGVTAVKSLPNGCGRCQIQLDLDFDEHCHDTASQEEFSQKITAELSRAFGGKISEKDVNVGGMKRGSIILFVFVPLLALAAAGLIGISWGLRNNWTDSRAKSSVSRKKLIVDPGEEEREVFEWDDMIAPDVDIGDTVIVWMDSVRKEHCVGVVLAVETQPVWRVQVGLPQEAARPGMWASLSLSASRLFKPNVSSSSDDYLVPKWFSLTDWQEARVEFGPTSDRILNGSRFYGELLWGDNSTRCSPNWTGDDHDGMRVESSLVVYRQFRVFV